MNGSQCSHGEFHGIRRDGWPSTLYFRCGASQDPCDPWSETDCKNRKFGEPRWFDKHGIEITREELNAIPNPMEANE